MWKIRGQFRNKPKNTLKFENWIADDNSSEAFSVLCFNTSADSSFELAIARP